MKFSMFSIFKPVRPKAEIIPEVTVWPKPYWLPIAIAKSPTSMASESAKSI